MTPRQIKQFFEKHASNKDKTLVIIDFSNVEKWKSGLGWSVGIRELGNLAKSFSSKKPLRRFYYGSDYGPKDSSDRLTAWSQSMLDKARMNGFEVITKRVKYMPRPVGTGYDVKCDLDVEMAVDLIKERNNYDHIIIFTGDGDLSYALRYIHHGYGKRCMAFGARDFIGRELIDAKTDGVITQLFFAQDFEYRLSYQRRLAR